MPNKRLYALQLVLRKQLGFDLVEATAGDGTDTAKITVSPFPATSVALVPYVNRWRGQIGLPRTFEPSFLLT